MPTLVSVFERHPATRVIIEMKHGTAALARAVVDVVRRMNAAARVCLGSFQHEAVDAARERSRPRLPQARLSRRLAGRFTGRGSGGRGCRDGLTSHSRFPNGPAAFGSSSPAFLRQVHREGQVVQVWVVDSEADSERLLNWGVDGLITDRPDVTVDVRDRWVTRNGRV